MLSLFSAADVFGGDAGRFAILTLVIIALFLLVRIVSRRGEGSSDFSAPPAHGAMRNASSFQPAADQSIRVHGPMRFETIELKQLYMREFDVIAGPPDPFEFVDELTAEVVHLATGEKSKWEFTVGTPSGFARLLERKGWESFYSPEIFVIRKYDLESLREMIVEHISSVLENRPSSSADQTS